MLIIKTLFKLGVMARLKVLDLKEGVSLEMSEGASYREQILDAARRNNTDLLEEILKSVKDPKQIAAIINDSKDALGNTPLHLASKYGSYEVLDILLDQEGVELEPKNNTDGDTPLHLAVRYSESEPEHGHFIVDTLIEAGADARIKNKHGDKPIDLTQEENLQNTLQGAEYAIEVEQEDEVTNAENVDDAPSDDD